MQIDLLVLDVDGVMTDGGIIRDDAGQQLKRFHVRDGTGVVMWHKLGKKVAIITGKQSQVVKHRAAELGIPYVYQDIANKKEAFTHLCEQLQITPDRVAYIGDDLPDLPVMKLVACPIAPADAVDEVKAIAKHITPHRGGDGAVRDGIEWLLKEMNLWQRVLERYQ